MCQTRRDLSSSTTMSHSYEWPTRTGCSERQHIYTAEINCALRETSPCQLNDNAAVNGNSDPNQSHRHSINTTSHMSGHCCRPTTSSVSQTNLATSSTSTCHRLILNIRIPKFRQCITLSVCLLLLSLVHQTSARSISSTNGPEISRMSTPSSEISCRPDVKLVDVNHPMRVNEQILVPLYWQADRQSNEVDIKMQSFLDYVDPNELIDEVKNATRMTHNDYKIRWKNKQIPWLHTNTLGHRKIEDENLTQEVKDHYLTTGRDYNVRNIIALLQDCEERLRLLHVGFSRKIAQHKHDIHDERQRQLVRIYTELQELVENDICTLTEHLARLSSRPRNAIDYSDDNLTVPRPDYGAWVLQREYLNQIHLMRDAVEAIQNGLKEYKSASSH